MGFDDDYWDRTDEEMLIDFHDWDSPAMEGITWDKLKEHGYLRINVGSPDVRAPHAEGNFPTPSGKCEFKSSLAEGGNFVVPVWRSMYDAMQPGEPIDPLPSYVPPFESPDSNPELAKRYPLNIVSPKPHAFLNSQYGNAQDKQRVQGEQRIFLHPHDAAERGIVTGDLVQVFNDRGMFQGPAQLDDALMPGLVMANVGHWASSSPGLSSVNSITLDLHCTLGNAGVYSDNLVDVAKLEPDRLIHSADSGA
jgi:anaerobic selenocysteine-containing dehydrogenase